jgi:hypothetical protein
MTDDKGSATGREFSIKRELQRKSIHLGMIIIPLWVYVTPHDWSVLGLIIATSATVVTDLLRLTDHRLRGFFLRFFRNRSLAVPNTRRAIAPNINDPQ